MIAKVTFNMGQLFLREILCADSEALICCRYISSHNEQKDYLNGVMLSDLRDLVYLDDLHANQFIK